MVRTGGAGGWVRGTGIPRRSGLRDAGPGLGAAAAVLAASRLARRHRASLEHLVPHPDPDTLAPGTVDAVVPARDEAPRIGACVEGLLRQGRGVAVTVMDDASGDGTGDVAAAAGARVIRVEGPPPGWLGKPHACHVARGRTSAPWLAFVDADTRLAPGAIAALVEHCERHGLDAASPLLRQRAGRLGDGLVVPFAYWQYLIGLPGGEARGGRRRGDRAILNGQCIVVRRDALERCGGHADPRVRVTAAEDAALARRLVATGHRVALVDGEELGEVTMYDGFAAVRAGFGKDAATFVLADPARGALVAGAGMAVTSLVPLAVSALRRPSRARLGGLAAAYLAPLPALTGEYRRSGQSAALALAHPVAAWAMQAIAIESLVRMLLRRPNRWKGRPSNVWERHAA